MGSLGHLGSTCIVGREEQSSFQPNVPFRSEKTQSSAQWRGRKFHENKENKFIVFIFNNRVRETLRSADWIEIERAKENNGREEEKKKASKTWSTDSEIRRK